MRFLDVKTDYAFKRVFGAESSKSILISFLNAILEYEGEQAVVDLTIVDPWQIPLIQGMKDTFVDVKAVLNNGKRVIIEMQVLNVAGLEQRILHNAAKQYATQLQRGEDYTLLNPVIAITFTDFTLFDDSAEHISRFRLIERERFIEYGDDVELIFIELPKFQRDLEALRDIQDKWIYFIKNAGRLEYIPETLGSDPAIRAAFEQINEAAMSLDELELQQKRHDFIAQQRGALTLATHIGRAEGEAIGEARGRAEGRAEGEAVGDARGKAEGRAEGERQKSLAIAAALLPSMPDAQIAQITGLSLQDVVALR